jgi:Protein of unknown function (DUF732)
MDIVTPTLVAISAAALILAPAAKADPGIFTHNEANYLEWLAGKGILPQTLGMTNGRDEVGLGYGVCDALNDHSASDVDAGIKRHWPNLTQLQVNAIVGFAVAAFCEQNAGKLS